MIYGGRGRTRRSRNRMKDTPIHRKAKKDEPEGNINQLGNRTKACHTSRRRNDELAGKGEHQEGDGATPYAA